MEAKLPNLDDFDLTIKQQKFCEEYVKTGNGTHSAIAAGYSEGTAYSMASENLRKPEIRKYLKELGKYAFERAGVTRERIVREQADIAFAEKDDEYVRASDKLKALELLDKNFTQNEDTGGQTVILQVAGNVSKL